MIVVCTPLTVVSRSWLMSLIITFMFEPAKLQMNCASASGARSRREEIEGALIARNCPPRGGAQQRDGESGPVPILARASSSVSAMGANV